MEGQTPSSIETPDPVIKVKLCPGRYGRSMHECPVIEFDKNRHSKDGYYAYCKNCRKPPSEVDYDTMFVGDLMNWIKNLLQKFVGKIAHNSFNDDDLDRLKALQISLDVVAKLKAYNIGTTSQEVEEMPTKSLEILRKTVLSEIIKRKKATNKKPPSDK